MPRLACSLAFVALITTQLLTAQVPTPEEVIGWPPCADYQVADNEQMLQYFSQLADATDRVQLIEIGRSAKGRPMPLLFISSEENMRQLDRWRAISEQLVRARISEDEARSLAATGKAIVLMPIMNPDGLANDAVWYRRVRGTPFETTDPPRLGQPWAGTDN